MIPPSVPTHISQGSATSFMKTATACSYVKRCHVGRYVYASKPARCHTPTTASVSSVTNGRILFRFSVTTRPNTHPSGLPPRQSLHQRTAQHWFVRSSCSNYLSAQKLRG